MANITYTNLEKIDIMQNKMDYLQAQLLFMSDSVANMYKANHEYGKDTGTSLIIELNNHRIEFKKYLSLINGIFNELEDTKRALGDMYLSTGDAS